MLQLPQQKQLHTALAEGHTHWLQAPMQPYPILHTSTHSTNRSHSPHSAQKHHWIQPKALADATPTNQTTPEGGDSKIDTSLHGKHDGLVAEVR